MRKKKHENANIIPRVQQHGRAMPEIHKIESMTAALLLLLLGVTINE